MPDPHCSADVLVFNDSGATADISICHSIGAGTVESTTWKGVAFGATTSGPLIVRYVLGDRNLDWWYCELTVGGVTYHSPGTWLQPDKECLLESADNGQILVFSASLTAFDINMPSGGCSTYMTDDGI